MNRRPKLIFVTTNRRVSLWPLCLLGDLLTKQFGRFYGIEYPRVLAEWKARTNRMALDLEQDEKVSRYLLAKVMRNHAWTGRVVSQTKSGCREIDDFTRKMHGANLSGLNDRQLFEYYRRYQIHFNRLYLPAWLPNALEGYSGTLTNYLNQYLESRVGTARSGKYLSVLTTPLQASFRQQEEAELLRLAARPSPTSSINESLKRHHAQYGWLTFDYDGPASDYRWLTRRYASLRKNNPGAALRRLTKKKGELHNLQRRYEHQLGLRSDKRYFYLFCLARDLMYLKEYRKDILTLSYYRMDWLFREIGRRLKLTPIQVKHILPAEMEATLKRRYFNRGELAKRLDYTVLQFGKSGIKLLTGSCAHRLVLKSTRESTPWPTDIITGTTAVPGKAKGRVQLIVVPEDMPKMHQGDVLVSSATNPNLLPAMKRAAAIVTDKGGITCHAAIVSRELNIPCVIGTKFATHLLKDGDRVEVDATRGTIKRF